MWCVCVLIFEGKKKNDAGEPFSLFTSVHAAQAIPTPLPYVISFELGVRKLFFLLLFEIYNIGTDFVITEKYGLFWRKTK